MGLCFGVWVCCLVGVRWLFLFVLVVLNWCNVMVMYFVWVIVLLLVVLVWVGLLVCGCVVCLVGLLFLVVVVLVVVNLLCESWLL